MSKQNENILDGIGKVIGAGATLYDVYQQKNNYEEQNNLMNREEARLLNEAESTGNYTKLEKFLQFRNSPMYKRTSSLVANINDEVSAAYKEASNSSQPISTFFKNISGYVEEVKPLHIIGGSCIIILLLILFKK